MIKLITILTNFILPSLVALSFSSCKSNDNWGMGTKGNGNITTETRTVTEDFTGIKVSASIDVVFEQSTNKFISVETDSNLQPIIDTKVENGILIIKPNASYSSSNGVKVTVKTPKIESLKASSSSSITTNGKITGSQMFLDASSSASINATLEVDTIEAEASSSATIDLSGKSLKLETSASSSSDINAYKLLSNDIVANASSSATIKIHPLVSLKAEANSSADIKYNGTPKMIDKRESSSGSISGR